MKCCLWLLVVVVCLEPGLPDSDWNAALLEWIQDMGGGAHGISLQPIPGMGMGVVSAKDLEVVLMCKTRYL